MPTAFDEMGWASDTEVRRLLLKDEEVKGSVPGVSMCGGEGVRSGVALVVTNERLLVVNPAKRRRPVDFVELAHTLDLWVFSSPQGVLLVETDARVVCFRFPTPSVLDRAVDAMQAVLPSIGRKDEADLLSHPLRHKIHPNSVHGLFYPAAPPFRPSPRKGPPNPPYPLSKVSDTLPLPEGLVVADVPGCGRGVVAARCFAAGQPVFEEEPLVVWPAGSEPQAADACWRDPETFAALADLQSHETSHPAGPTASEPPVLWYKRFSELIQVNAWEYSAGGDPQGRAIFRLASFLNNSCDPNVRYDTKDGRRAAVFRALRDILPGEELTVCYVHALPATARNDANASTRRFICKCRRCEESDAARQVEGPVSEEDERWAFGLADHLASSPSTPETDVSLLAAFFFCASRIGPKHGSTYMAAEAFLDSETPGGGVLPFMVRYVTNWVEMYPFDLILSRPPVTHALARALSKLQEDQTPDPVPIISLAARLHPVLAVLKGPDDPDTLGMGTVAQLLPLDYDCFAGFCWDMLRDSASAVAAVIPNKATAERVKERVAVYAEAFAAKSDPYDL